MYSIRDLEQLSGIKAHTIRIWEKRYNLLNPDRSDTNIRTYSDAQLIKLLNVATLLEKDWKISKVSKLTDDQIQQEIEQSVLQEDELFTAQVNQLLTKSIEFDEKGFDHTLSYSLLKYGVRDTVLNLIYPFLRKVGIFWRINRMNPAQEHFSSNLIRRKLLSMIDGQEAPSLDHATFLLFLPSSEYHELSLIISDYLIRQQGFKTIYLGADVPFENVQDVVKKTKTTHIITFFSTPVPETELSAYLDKMMDTFKDEKVIACGPIIRPEHIQARPNMVYLDSIDAMETYLTELAKQAGSNLF